MSNNLDDFDDKRKHIGAHNRWLNPQQNQHKRTTTYDQVVPISEVTPRDKPPLIDPFFSTNEFVGLCGPEGSAKTQLAILMGALITNKDLALPFSDSKGTLTADTFGTVVFIGTEDDVEFDIWHRVTAAGALPENYYVLNPGSLSERKLKDTLYAVKNLKLIIIDHWSLIYRGYRSKGNNLIDSVKDILEFAKGTGATTIVIGHYCKSAKKTISPIDRADFPKPLRIKLRKAFYCEPYSINPETGERLFAFISVKTSHTGDFPGFLYRILPAVVEKDGQQFKTSRVELVRLMTIPEVAEITANSANLPIATPSKLDEAIAFLLEALKDGPVVGNEVIAVATKAGISVGTLARARKELDVQHNKESGGSGRSVWSLPDAA